MCLFWKKRDKTLIRLRSRLLQAIPIISQTRYLEKKGELQEMSKGGTIFNMRAKFTSVYLFLFNDLLIIAAKKGWGRTGQRLGTNTVGLRNVNISKPWLWLQESKLGNLTTFWWLSHGVIFHFYTFLATLAESRVEYLSNCQTDWHEMGCRHSIPHSGWIVITLVIPWLFM